MNEKGTNRGGVRNLTLIVLLFGLIVNSVSAVAPTAAFAYVPASGFAPLTIQFTDASLGVPDTWNWSFGDGTAWVNGTTATQRNPVHTFSSTGFYTITLVCNNTDGSDTLVGVDYVYVEPVPQGITIILSAYAIAGIGLIVAGVILVVRPLMGVSYKSRYSGNFGGELVAGMIAILLGALLLIVGYFLLSPLFTLLGL